MSTLFTKQCCRSSRAWLGTVLGTLLGTLIAGCAGAPPADPASGPQDQAAAAVGESVEAQANMSEMDFLDAASRVEAFPELPDLDLTGEVVSTVAEPPKVDRSNELAFDQAVAALRAGRLQEAEVLLLQITADQPELAGPWVNLGQVYVLLKQFEDARMAFASAVEANPRSCAAHNQLGVLSRQFGDFRGAEEHYRACLENVPRYKDAYLNLGILYELYLGKLPQALEAYRRYQLLAAEPDRRVKGWVMDLERRLGV